MNKYPKIQRIFLIFTAFLGLPYLLGLGAIAQAQTGTATFNTASNDLPNLQVGNYTLNPNCSTCWQASLSNVHNGDIISFEIYYHNTSNITAYNTRMSLTLSNTGSGVTVSSRLWADNASPVSGSVTVTLAAGLSQMKLAFNTAIWGPNQTVSGSTPLPNGQTGAEVLTSSGVNIGNIAPGWSTQGNLVVRFTASGGTTTGGNPPTVQTQSANNITSSGATLNGMVNPNGSNTSFWFEYGTTQSLGSTIPNPSQSAGSGTTSLSAVATLSNLSPNTTYYYRIDAQNQFGTSQGSILSFTTAAGSSFSAPVVQTSPATNIGTGSATLNGTVNPNGLATNYWFEYGTTTSFGQSTPQQSAGSGNSVVSVSAPISSLSPNTTYYFRLNAQSSYGTTQGSILSFATTAQACPVPVVQTQSATNINLSGATLNGLVSTNGVSTNYWFEYGTTTSLGQSTSQQLVGAGSQNVSFNIGTAGVNPGTIFYFRVDAQNQCGTVQGSTLSFVSAGGGLVPTVTTQSANNITTTNATLNGNVNPNGLATNYWFEYGTTASLGQSTSQQSAGSGSSAVLAVASIGSLSPNTVYYFRLDASNSAGLVQGSISSFTTQSVGNPTLVITPSSASISVGQNQSFSALYDPDGPSGPLPNQDVTQSANWSSNNTSVAQFVSAGQFRGAAQGSATVTATYLSLTATANLSVVSSGGGAPTATTNVATGINPQSATLNATVSANGSLTNVWFVYGQGSGLGTATPSQSLQANATNQSVSINVSNLQANTTYSFQAIAQNSNGTVNGNVMTFTTPNSGGGGGGAPTVTTNIATNIAFNSATLNASVNPNGSLTNVWFLYGQGSNTNLTSFSQSLSAGTAAQNVSVNISNLQANTTYSFQAVAQNSNGTVNGNVMTFTTPNSGGGGGGNGAPLVTTNAATNLSQNSAVLNGSVNPQGALTNYWFLYGQGSNVNQQATPSQSLGASSGYQSVSYAVYNLIPNSTYSFQLVAQNSFGTTYGNILTFTTFTSGGGYFSNTLTIVPSSANISSGQTQYFTAYYYPSGSNYQQDVTQSAVWSISNSSIAQLVGQGQFRGTGNGSVTVSAQYAGFYASAQLYVSGYGYNTGNTPTVVTNAATNIYQGSATLNGSVNPNGADAQVWFQYGTDSNNLTLTTSQSFQSGSGNYSMTNFSQAVSNLVAGTTYYFRAAAQNTYGTVYGQTLSFTTGSGGYAYGQTPTVLTLTASPVYQNSAILQGDVNPNGGLTSVWFEYGTTNALGSQTASQSAGNGSTYGIYSFSVSGLTANTTYYFRADAQNQYGTSHGSILTFTTQTGYVAPAPTVSAPAAPAPSTACAILEPTFTPGTPVAGQNFEYDLTYRNDCGYRLRNATLRIILPTEFIFSSASDNTYTQESYGLQYVLGNVAAGYQATIVIKGAVKDTAVTGDALVFGAILDFTDQNGRFRSVSAFVSPIVGVTTPAATPSLGASLFGALGSLFGSWLWLLLLLIIIALLIYWIFFKESDGKMPEAESIV